MKTMTLDEVKKLPPLTAEEVAAVKSFKDTDFSDCPKQTKEELANFFRESKSQKTVQFVPKK